jgi:hypothetical protein
MRILRIGLKGFGFGLFCIVILLAQFGSKMPFEAALAVGLALPIGLGLMAAFFALLVGPPARKTGT